jgi:hypothetical protein
MLKYLDLCLNFFLDQLVKPTITLLYKRQLFIYLVLIVKSWINAGFIYGDRARRISVDLVQIKNRLKKQNLKKMGKFKPIEFNLQPQQIFSEFERGLSTQFLYALEDFNDWTEGKQQRKRLLQSGLRNDPRFQVTELLYKIAQQVCKEPTEEEALADIEKMQQDMIQSYLEEILDQQFKLLPELTQIFYGTFTVHILNLAFEAGKISDEERSEFLKQLSEFEEQQYKQLYFPLLNYSESRIFSEDYEKEFSSLVNIFHLSVPVYNL